MTYDRYSFGFSRLDLVASIAAVVVLVAVLLPFMARSKGDHSRITCTRQLKSLGIAFRLYATDGAPYPSFTNQFDAWKNFQLVGKEIGSPKVLLCPKDVRINPALDFETPPTSNSFANPAFQNRALSYFYGLEANENEPNKILAGDRNLSTNAHLLSGMLVAETNSSLGWTKDLHVEQGNILLADDSAQQVSSARLMDQLKAVTNSVQRFILP